MAACFLAGSVVLAADARTELRRFDAVEPHMGTLVRLVVYTPDARAARAAFAAGFDRIRDLDAILSDYRADSELSRLASVPVGYPVRTSDDLFAVLRAAQAVAEATDGAFDITLGPVIRLWRDARRSGRPPDAEARAAAAARSGFRHLTLDDAQQTVTMGVAGMMLDAGGIGKGYAASEALAAMARLGVPSALVAVSGDLAFSAAPPGTSGWRIALATGREEDDEARQAVVLEHAAVSTSGASAQHLDAGGQRYSHIIDPASGIGLRDDLTVTVIAPTGAEADALATAVSVLGVERGLRLLDARPGVSGAIVVRTAAGPCVCRSTRFPAEPVSTLPSCPTVPLPAAATGT